MKTIEVRSNKLKAFDADMDAAFKMLALMISENDETRFWFGSTDGSISGDVSLIINGPEYCKTLSEYPRFDESKHWNNNYYNLDDNRKNEIRENFYKTQISPHEKFMNEFGNELKNETL